jgi:RNA polymerase sigma-70 factor, ECF subfamily
MDDLTLTKWMLATALNNEAAFRQLVEHCQSRVYATAFRILCNEDDAKDIVQETFLRIWLNRNAYQSDKKFTSWMYSIATNLCLDKLKTQKRRSWNKASEDELYLLIASDDIEQALADAELETTIRNLTRHLSPKQKVVFTLTDLEDMDLEEIVQITKQSPAKIKSNLYLARQAMRKMLNKMLNDTRL